MKIFVFIGTPSRMKALTPALLAFCLLQVITADIFCNEKGNCIGDGKPSGDTRCGNCHSCVRSPSRNIAFSVWIGESDMTTVLISTRMTVSTTSIGRWISVSSTLSFVITEDVSSDHVEEAKGEEHSQEQLHF
ncbi:hypothetical protein GCK72_003739 [Caenorhabditis remanei]|uniref:Secreted protein n=1 Tax=Caenorhabditis remanei TaxID=31234 RepID=A0A6A5HAD4_CAERE|nr:hypothetical protein GCK72_003739 [Caenorhabditis remanei]KAF1763794.1 hypothetical protein GCK72_003739 [Caenorhabditis remanei]